MLLSDHGPEVRLNGCDSRRAEGSEMGKGRRSRMDLRREAEAVEARKRETDEEVEGEETEEGDEEEDDDEEEAEAEVEVEAEAEVESDEAVDDDEGGDDDEDRPKKKKKPKKVVAKKAPAKKAATKRTRTAKEVRTRAVWVVFDNASKRVDTFPYNQKADAEALLARKLEEKKGTFYINLVKEEIKDESK